MTTTTPTNASKYEALYTWRFSERSLLIRLYLFVYGDEKRSSINFCKLFWGTCFLAVTLPVTIVVKVAGLLGRGVGATGTSGGRVVASVARAVFGAAPVVAVRRMVAAYFDASAERLKEKGYARYRARQALERQEELGHLIWFLDYGAERPPPKPTPSRRILEAGAGFGDRLAAWWQAHPEIGRGADRAFLILGRVVVRGVFYPLMVLVPVALTSLAVWETWRHRSGLVEGFLVPARVLRHVGWLSLKYGGLALGLAALAVAIFVVSALVLAGFIWVGIHYAERQESRWNAMPQEQRLARMAKASRVSTWLAGGGVGHDYSRQTWGARTADWTIPAPRSVVALLDATDYAAIRVGRVAGRGAKKVGRGFRRCGHGVGRVGGGVGRGFVTTGRFFVEGHHAVKTRTCPRILIDSER